jgi:cbb3-type cytochrome oxidase subunit 3
MVILIRFIFFCLILLLGYLILKYVLNPKRKLEMAQQNGQLYLLDEANNIRRNLLITLKGAVFEGEKYMGTADDAFRIIHIKLWPKNKDQLHGLSKNDFMEMERLIFERYPYSTLEWTSPVKDLFHDKE